MLYNYKLKKTLKEYRKTIDEYNKSLNKYIEKSKNILKTLTLEQFDYEKYYDDMLHFQAADENNLYAEKSFEDFKAEIEEKKANYLKGDLDEIKMILENNADKFKIDNPFLNDVSCIFIDEKMNATLEIKFTKIEEDLIKRKKLIFNNNKAEEIQFTHTELEKIFQKAALDHALALATKILYFFKGKVKSIEISLYKEDVNNEKQIYFKSKISQGSIPYDQINTLDGETFFKSQGAIYFNPLLDMRVIEIKK